MDENGTYRWSPNGGNKPKPPVRKPDFKKAGRYAVLIVVAAVLAVALLTCFYTVDDKQQAVVTTFGRVTDVTEAGVHFKLPFGIQQVYKVDVNVYQKIELG